MRQPNFDNLLKVLNNEIPDRPTLFEFFLNQPLYCKLAGVTEQDPVSKPNVIKAFITAGYDYATIMPDFSFPRQEISHEQTISLNEGVSIANWDDFEKYPWPDADQVNYGELDELAAELPPGAKFICQGPGGVLENVITLLGYDNICFLLMDDRELFKTVVDNVGSRLVQYYERVGKSNAVGAMISNDDWGFKSQPMLSPDDMREYIIPWHVKIAAAIHSHGKPAILHSCGNLASLMDDIIDDCKYDGKHSYEDIITPVEEAYELWGDRIAILGGIDLDFLCRRSVAAVTERAENLLELTAGRGGYALGSGNSIPDYVPDEKYFAMVKVATGLDYSKYFIAT
jgi:uroporphyrinogen decarboxylase